MYLNIYNILNLHQMLGQMIYLVNFCILCMIILHIVPLIIIFNESFNLGKLPFRWKHCVVTPVFKKGDLAVATNYGSK